AWHRDQSALARVPAKNHRTPFVRGQSPLPRRSEPLPAHPPRRSEPLLANPLRRSEPLLANPLRRSEPLLANACLYESIPAPIPARRDKSDPPQQDRPLPYTPDQTHSPFPATKTIRICASRGRAGYA